MFRERHDAGRQLAHALIRYKDAKNAIVLALPRGGVVIGYEISLGLRLLLDVLITRKLGTPWNSELAMGTLAETGYRHLNAEVIQATRSRIACWRTEEAKKKTVMVKID
jgi:putative phosphoribosyl transferase